VWANVVPAAIVSLLKLASSAVTVWPTEPVFDYVELDPVSVKGKAEPVPMWRAMASRARFGTDITRKLATPLVGRELERNLLTGRNELSLLTGRIKRRLYVRFGLSLGRRFHVFLRFGGPVGCDLGGFVGLVGFSLCSRNVGI